MHYVPYIHIPYIHTCKYTSQHHTHTHTHTIYTHISLTHTVAHCAIETGELRRKISRLSITKKDDEEKEHTQKETFFFKPSKYKSSESVRSNSYGTRSAWMLLLCVVALHDKREGERA